MNNRPPQSSRLIQRKENYKECDLYHNVQLEPNLIVRLIKYQREYHYQCLLCNYHVRIKHSFNKNHIHEKYKSMPSSSKQTKLTDFTKHFELPEDLDLNHQAQIYIGLLSVLTRVSPYSLGKVHAQNTIGNLIQLGFEYKQKNPEAQSLPSNFLKYTPTNISQSISNLDQAVSTKILEKFNGKMINIFVDAGTVNTVHSIEILISSSDIPPYPYASISNFHFLKYSKSSKHFGKNFTSRM